MRALLHLSRHIIVISVLGCLVMFGGVTIFGAVAVGQAIVEMTQVGTSVTGVATVTVHVFKILDVFLMGAILYIVALGLGALFLDTKSALPAWFEVHELQDLKIILSQSVIVVMLVTFLGDVLEWEQGSDIAFVGGGIALVVAALAYMLKSARQDRGA